MYRVMVVYLCFAMLIGLSSVSAQDDATPFLPENLEVITPENVLELQPIAEIGRGLLYDVLLLDDGTLAAVTSRGVYLYADGDLNAQPRFIAYAAGAFSSRYALSERAETTLIDDSLIVTTAEGGVRVDLTAGTSEVSLPRRQPDSPIETTLFAYSPDASIQAITTDESNVVTLIHTITSETIGELTVTERARIGQMVFSPDGSQLFISGNYRGSEGRFAGVQVWDVAGQERVNLIETRRTPTLFRESESLVVISEGVTTIYDVNTLEVIDTIDVEIGALSAETYVTLQPGESSDMLDVVLVDIESNAETARIENAICISSLDSNRFIYDEAREILYHAKTQFSGGTIDAYDLSQDAPQLVGEVAHFRSFTSSIAFSPDSASLYAAYESLSPFCLNVFLGDSVVRYDMFTGIEAKTLPFPADLRPVTVATNANGDVLAGGLNAFAFYTNGTVVEGTAQQGYVTSLALSDEGRAFAYANESIVELARDGTIQQVLVDPRSLNPNDFNLIFWEDSWAHGIAAAGNLLIHATAPYTIAIRDLATDDVLHTLSFQREINNIAYDPESNILAVHTGEGYFEDRLNDLYLFRVTETVEDIAVIQVNTIMTIMDIVPGGGVLALTHFGGSSVPPNSQEVGETLVHFYDTATGSRIGGLVEDNFNETFIRYPLAFSPDGRLMIVAGGNGNLLVYGVVSK